MNETLLSFIAGWQCLLDLFDCETPLLDSVEWVQATLVEAARLAEATIVSESFHRFPPHGVSGVVVIAKSHIAIHTWPERRYAAVDVFTCNSDLHVERAVNYLIEAFQSSDARLARFTRGDDKSLLERSSARYSSATNDVTTN